MKSIGIIAANWKMNKTADEARSFVEKSSKLLLNMEKAKVIFCPPFTALFDMDKSLEGKPWFLGAQNMHWEDSGAFTGEVSSAMLKASGVQYVILGHSERRHQFGEQNDWINKKVLQALSSGLNPIFCVGETLDERQSGNMEEVLKTQISEGLQSVDDPSGMLIAYEPVWAIGTGQNADEEQIEEAHKLVSTFVCDSLGDIGKDIPVLYGGSVNPENAGSLFRADGVDGFLVGGASLEPESFSNIIKEVDILIKE